MQTSEFTKLIASAKQAQTKKKKLFRLRNFLWMTCISTLISVGIFVLLLHKPAGYKSPEPIKDNEVSKYLTHVLMRDLYNGAQLQEPFKLEITQEGINDIIARFQWPQSLDNLTILVPEVIFEPGEIILRGTVQTTGVDLLITISGIASMNKEGLLNLAVSSVKIGAVNITLVAKAVAQSIFEKELLRRPDEPERIEDKIINSVINGKPFDPVFRIEENSVRIVSVSIEKGNLTLGMNGANAESVLEVSRTPND